MNRDPSAFDNQTDAALVAASLAGDKVAFGRIVTRHWLRVRRVAGRCLPHAFEVDDVAQEAFLQAYLSLSKLRKPEHVGVWVCGIASNLAKMRLRSYKPTERLGDVESGNLVSAESIAIQNEQLRLLHDAIDTLPPAERAAIWHVYHDGMSLRETAAKLAISLSAAKVRVHRGRQRLRHQLLEQTPMIPVDIHDTVLWTTFEGPPPSGKRHERFLTVVEASTLLDEANRALQDGKPNPLGSDPRFVAMFLKERAGKQAMPIWISPIEADVIVLEMGRPNWNTRPQTHDLMLRILETGGVSIKQLVVSSLENHVFIGTLTLSANGETQELDCRPSDGMVLATKLDFPIFVAPAVMDHASMLPNAQGLYARQPTSESTDDK